MSETYVGDHVFKLHKRRNKVLITFFFHEAQRNKAGTQNIEAKKESSSK